MFKGLGSGDLQPCVVHPCNLQHNLYLSFDYCHIIKNIRSQFLDQDIADREGMISSKFIKEIYRIQKDLAVKPIRFLMRKHVEPSSFEKMNVLYAVQTFSLEVTSTLDYMKDNHIVLRLTSRVNFSEAGPTIRFMKNVYKFFTVHNISDKLSVYSILLGISFRGRGRIF